MCIMPDSWIRKMAEEKGMIDPFIDKLEKSLIFPSTGDLSNNFDFVLLRPSNSF